jgi:hypothetical protein
MKTGSICRMATSGAFAATWAPHLFAWPDEDEPGSYPPPTDLVPKEQWDHLMILPTDVALKSSSYEGSTIPRLATLDSAWIFSWPEPGEAPFMEEVSLLAGEEFNALVFNALHGYYRQAIGCLRNAIETLIAAAALAVTGNQELFNWWRKGGTADRLRPGPGMAEGQHRWPPSRERRGTPFRLR